MHLLNAYELWVSINVMPFWFHITSTQSGIMFFLWFKARVFLQLWKLSLALVYVLFQPAYTITQLSISFSFTSYRFSTITSPLPSAKNHSNISAPHLQGSPNRWEPVQFDRFSVLPVRLVPKNTGKPTLTKPSKPDLWVYRPVRPVY
jgi:hypothetical protein